MTDAIDAIEFLARSPTRVRLLETVGEHGQRRTGDLRDQFDVSRTTLQRNLDMLEEQGWLHRTAREYTLTPSGELVSEEFGDLMETVQFTTRLKPFLKWIPEDAFDLDLRSLTDAELILADPNDPYATVNRHVDALKTTTTFRGLLPVVGQQSVETGWQRIRERGVEHEIVVGPGSAEVLQSNPGYRKPLEKAISTEQAQVFVSDRNVPYFIGVYDDFVQLGVEDDEGMPRAMLETGAEDVREWANRTHTEFKQQAEPLAVPETQDND